MTIEEIKNGITQNFAGSYIIESAEGDLFFFYGSDIRFPFATLVTKDNDFDQVSNLNREGYYRLNIGIDKDDFKALFGTLKAKPGIGGYLDSGVDFTEENKLMPHPFYGNMYWISVVKPDKAMYDSLQPYLTIAYTKAVEKENKRLSNSEPAE